MIDLPRTSLYIYNQEKFNWAKYQAAELWYESVSEYIFALIKLAQDKGLKPIKEKS